MKVLVTGSLGRIGSQIIPLLADDFELVLTDITAGEVAGLPVSPLDITDYQSVFSAMKGVDSILHLAIASQRNIVTNKPLFERDEGDEYLAFNDLTIETNIRGTYHLFEAARRNQVPRVVYGSSLTIYLGSPAHETFHDDLPARPHNFYALSKLWGEQIGELFSRKHGLRVYCLRLGTPYPQPEVPEFTHWLKNPRALATFVTFSDLAGAMKAALLANGPLYGAYTIVSAKSANIFDLSKSTEIHWQPLDFIEPDGTISSTLEMAS